MNWNETRKLPWKSRNAAVEAALRGLLAARLASLPALSTRELAAALGGDDDLAGVLSKLAPWMGKLATHDGPKFKAFGRIMTRWQWRGQCGD